MNTYRIVLTGGPCGGKSTIINSVAKRLEDEGYNVIVVNETAREIMEKGNIAKPEDRDYTLKFQEMILQEQLRKEKSVNILAQTEGNKNTIILYDRGTMDNRAFLSCQKDFDSILKKNNVTELNLLNRYDIVIHLASLATTNNKDYINDDIRKENPNEAKILDNKIATAWLLHPNFHIIMPTKNIKDKEDLVISYINDFLNNRKELNEYSLPISKDKERFFVKMLNNNNSKQIIITENTRIDCKYSNFKLIKREFNMDTDYTFEEYDDTNSELYFYKSKSITKEDYIKALQYKNVWKQNKTVETYFIMNNQICKISKDKNNNVIITFVNNRTIENLNKYKNMVKVLEKPNTIW